MKSLDESLDRRLARFRVGIGMIGYYVRQVRGLNLLRRLSGTLGTMGTDEVGQRYQFVKNGEYLDADIAVREKRERARTAAI